MQPAHRRILHRAVPAHFHNPAGLAMRLLRSKSPEAYFAMFSSAMGAATFPLDAALQFFERRRYASAAEPKLPLVIVCGPPRSGTTLVTQVLLRHLPVAYFNNLTSIFPKSPITANRIFRGLIRNDRITSRNYYGKTFGFYGHNDALYLWDRWLGGDRTRIPKAIPPERADAMRRFFGAWEAAFGRPTIGKNNSLNVSASVVARELPVAHFICLRRDPFFLAQSLLIARRQIHGADGESYGVDDDSRSAAPPGDVYEDVCRQTLFHESKMDEQERLIGPARFWRLQYEDFCGDPAGLVGRVASEILRQPIDVEGLRKKLAPYQISSERKLDEAEFERLGAAMERVRGAAPARGSAPSPEPAAAAI